MREVVNKSLELNIRIKESSEYNNYITTKKALYENVELCNQLKEFRRRNYELQTREGENPYDEINSLVREYEVLLHNRIVSDYLRAEQRICKNMQQIYTSLADGLEFDFLDE